MTMFDYECDASDNKPVDQDALLTDTQFALLMVLVSKLYPDKLPNTPSTSA